MNKTQESVLKQCISFGLLGFIFFGLAERGWAYTSIAPWIDHEGPPRGLIFEPAFGFQPDVESGNLEWNANINAAVSSDWSLYGRYSVQNDHLLGTSLRLARLSNFELLAQAEAALTPDSTLSYTAGFYGKAPTSLFGIPNFVTEMGFGVSYAPINQSTRIPLSILLLHAPESGWQEGAAVRGELDPANDNWLALQFLGAYQTRAGLRYQFDFSVPLSERTNRNDTTLLMSLAIPFQTRPEPEFQAKQVIENPTKRTPQYDLNAVITSMNESLFLLKINKGSSDSIAEGQTFDVYSNDELVARTQVLSVKKDEAALNVIEYMEEHWIELGFTARRLRGME